MSNAAQEFAAFERASDAVSGSKRDARIALIDAAVGGYTAAEMAQAAPDGKPLSPYWQNLDTRISAQGLSAKQVQIAWLKVMNPASQWTFPSSAHSLESDIGSILRHLHARFPNMKIAFLSSRSYGGYSPSGEPAAFESGFAVKWVIEQQISGSPSLSYGGAAGPARAPVLLWGPYLWAPGPTANAAGLHWDAADFEADGTHPSGQGEEKVAALLAKHFATDLAATSWWAPMPGAAAIVVDAAGDAGTSLSSPGTNFGSSPTLDIASGPAVVRMALPTVLGSVVHAKLSFRVETEGTGTLATVDPAQFDETTLTAWTLPPPLVALPQISYTSRESTIALNVTGEVVAALSGSGAFAVRTDASQTGTTPFSLRARESGDAPRLVLTVVSP